MARTVAEQLAAEAKELTFRDLPPEVIHQVKRLVLDTVGVAFGGYQSDSSQIIQSLIKEIKEPTESTVFGSGLKTSCLYATLANGVMVRYLEFMDRNRLPEDFLSKAVSSIHGHHSESIPPVLAVGERQRSTGQEIITAIVVAYELATKFSDSINSVEGIGNLPKMGWKQEIKTPYVMALVVGRLLGLSEEQMAHALAVAGCFSAELGILEVGDEEVTMARNLMFPYGAYHGILGALLAQKGFEGPLRVFEGHHGFAEVVLRGNIDLEKLTQRRKDWSILHTWIKSFAADCCMHSHLAATISLVKEHDIRPENVSKVKITTPPRTYQRVANPAARRHAETWYTAAHSSYYTTALAILDRTLGADQLSDEKFHDPRVQELADKVFIEPDPKLEELALPDIVEITTRNGDHYSDQVDYPKGHPVNPMTDTDIEEKFRSMAGKFMRDEQMAKVITTISNLDKLDDVGELVKLLVIPVQSAS